MYRKTKRLCAAVLSVVMALSAASCKKKDDSSSEETTVTTTTAVPAATEVTETTTTTVTTTATTTTTTAAKEEKKVSKKSFNPLTGLYNISKSAQGRRPCAVMVNNIAASLPQYGIYSADILFEIPVEGGITRLMALYADEAKMPNVCSVRSARYYFALFAQSFDAVYLHWGIDKKVAEPMLVDLGIDHIDGYSNESIFGRDPERLQYYATEHTAYLSGSGVVNEIDRLGIRSEPKDGYNSFFKFYDEFTKPSGDKCSRAVVYFSDYYVSQFDYDSKSQTYKKLHNGSKHMDSAVNKQLEFTNLLILETNEIKVINQNNGLISVDWSGGSGYLITGGKVKKIKWSKKDEFAKLKLTDENDKTIKLNTGKTYIGIAPKGKTALS